MTKISHQGVLKFARLSRIVFPDSEIKLMSEELEAVATYVHRVCDIAAGVTVRLCRNVNVFREDMIVSDNAEIIVAQAPERVQDYFVVPMVLEKKE